MAGCWNATAFQRTECPEPSAKVPARSCFPTMRFTRATSPFTTARQRSRKCPLSSASLIRYRDVGSLASGRAFTVGPARSFSGVLVPGARLPSAESVVGRRGLVSSERRSTGAAHCDWAPRVLPLRSPLVCVNGSLRYTDAVDEESFPFSRIVSRRVASNAAGPSTLSPSVLINCACCVRSRSKRSSTWPTLPPQKAERTRKL